MNLIVVSFLVASVGGAAGGLVAGVAGMTVLRSRGERFRGSVLAFSGGFILAAAFLELVQRALEDARAPSVLLVLAGVAAGAAARATITSLVGAGGGRDGSDRSVDGKYRSRQARKIGVSLAAVNAVEGITIGVGFAVGTGLGLLLAAIMAFENFTEGLSVSSELAQAEERSTRRIILLTTAPTLTLGVGAALGAYLGGLSSELLPGLLGAGAGIMLYVVADDIVYDAHRVGAGAVTTWPLITGTMLGIALAGLT